jgi:aspartate/methionine/tyrosine aminotransferase
MKIAPFETEHFFARYEFNTPHQLCNSDCETLTVGELLRMAGQSREDLANVELGYTESQGSLALRSAIAGMYTSVAADEVVVLGSPVEGIYLAARSILEPGDEVVVLTPAYDALVNLFEHTVGPGNVKRWRFEPEGNRWTLDPETLRGLISDRTRLLVVNFPHNPTGYLPSVEMQREIAEIASDHGLWLFCDEMYFGLVHSGTAPIPSGADVSNPNGMTEGCGAIVLSGLSKTYGLPGLRCGWLIVRDESLRADIMNWKFYTSICPPAPTEFLALTAMQVLDQLQDQNISRIERNLELAEAFFERWGDKFVWRRPQAGSVALVGYQVPSVQDVAIRLAEEAGVLIHPAVTLGSDDHHMRLGFGRDAFGQALARFEDWLTNNS